METILLSFNFQHMSPRCPRASAGRGAPRACPGSSVVLSSFRDISECFFRPGYAPTGGTTRGARAARRRRRPLP